MLLTGIILLSIVSAAASCLASGVGLHWLWVLPLSLIGSFLGYVILAALFILVAALCVDQNKPQEHDSKFYRTLIRLYGPFVLTVGGARIHTKGLEQIPGVRLIGPADLEHRVGVVSVDFMDMDNAAAGDRLEQEFGMPK